MNIQKNLRFICLLALTFTAIIAVNGKTYLVSVGISNYSRKPLKLTVHDAEVIKWVYEKNGDSEVILLTNNQATCEAVGKAVKSLYAKAKDDDCIIFFFSGHGMPGTFVCNNGFLGYNVILDAMASSRAKRKMMFIDACFSGNVRKVRKKRQTPVQAVPDYKKLDVMFFLSCRDNETSIEVPKVMKNGFFTAFLQRGLKGGADTNKDRVITAHELFNFVHSGVVKISSGKQHPVVWGNFDNNMPVMKW